MSATSERSMIDPSGDHISVRRFGDASQRARPLVLVHGTAFVADVWEPVAERLCQTRAVYAIDRRAHGRSFVPPLDRLHFADFASDLVRVIDALGLEDAIEVGHSAGATDILLSATQRPRQLAGIFAMEPTAMDADGNAPSEPETYAPAVGALARDFIEQTRRRRAELPDARHIRERYRKAPVFASWTERSLDRYSRGGHGAE